MMKKMQRRSFSTLVTVAEIPPEGLKGLGTIGKGKTTIETFFKLDDSGQQNIFRTKSSSNGDIGL
ncbi:hypothetical protein CFP56_007279 [Quercus suber]|uniref:Uncharacterized protein n=1 Tax=Quercus suber TaxID=58331 RepID=A0AAW0L838_QUESU